MTDIFVIFAMYNMISFHDGQVLLYVFEFATGTAELSFLSFLFFSHLPGEYPMTYGTILYSVSFFPFSQANKAYRTPP